MRMMLIRLSKLVKSEEHASFVHAQSSFGQKTDFKRVTWPILRREGSNFAINASVCAS
jgi:hypothetical protein